MNGIFFDTDDFTDLAAKHLVDDKLKKFLKTERAGQFAVVLHNDPINSVEYVTKVIMKVFGYGTGKSVWLMLKAHFTGRSILWLGSHSEASDKQRKLIACGPDPSMIHRGAEPLTVTVEKQD
jgi:ATP-dependent Clp protease adaptor protein ClpS